MKGELQNSIALDLRAKARNAVSFEFLTLRERTQDKLISSINGNDHLTTQIAVHVLCVCLSDCKTIDDVQMDCVCTPIMRQIIVLLAFVRVLLIKSRRLGQIAFWATVESDDHTN